MTKPHRAIAAIAAKDGDVRPEWENGVPHCDTERCSKYDGKRCRVLGRRPGVLCEPAVETLVELLDARIQDGKP